MDKEKQILYDQVISTLISNVMAEKKHNHRIILREFDSSSPSHMLYYTASTIISDIGGDPIYLNMKLWDYIKFVCKNFKRWKKLKWMSNTAINEWSDSETNPVTPVETIIMFVKQFFLKEKELTFEEFDTIYGQVYLGEGGEK